MIPYPHINPDLFTIGPLHVRWYGVMYVAGFLGSYFLIKLQEKAKPVGLSPRLVRDLMFYLASGLLPEPGWDTFFSISTRTWRILFAIRLKSSRSGMEACLFTAA